MSYNRVGVSTVRAIIVIILEIVGYSMAQHDNTKECERSVSFALCRHIKKLRLSGRVCAGTIYT